VRRFGVLPVVSLIVSSFHGLPSSAQGQSAPSFIRPTSVTILAAGWFEIAAVVPDNPGSFTMTLDGQSIASKVATLGPAVASGSSASSASLLIQMNVEQLASGVRFSPSWIAVREITPGAHELKLGPTSVRFRAVVPGSVDKETSDSLRATSTTLYAAHPLSMVGMVTCAGCHSLNRESQPPRFEDMTTLSPPSVPDVCFRCHEQAKFLSTHAHRVEHLAFCQMCHDPHGANRAKLMKLPRQDACKKCHE